MGRNYASLTLSYSWEGSMQNMPPVTLGEELGKTCFAQVTQGNFCTFMQMSI